MLIVAALLVACDPPKPRSFEFFMEDGLAREGVLVRCNANRDATLDDAECSNARRAAIVVAAEAEGERTGDLERESERKLVALRNRGARAEQAEQDAASAARGAAKAAYEAQWQGAKDAKPSSGDEDHAAPAAFGAPLGQKMPSMNETSRLDEAYDESLSRVPALPELEIAAVTPPQVEVTPPEVEIERAAIIPRPFRENDGTTVTR